METTIKATLKGKHMEQIFDSCKNFMVKFYNNKTMLSDEDFDEEKKYNYEIVIRHSEGTNARTLFTDEVKTLKNK